jgi:hypothetical protein
VAVAVLLAACGGGESSSNANEPSSTYDVRVTEARFPTEQDLGQTSLLRIGVRNSGEKTVPALTVSLSIGGKEGSNSKLPFGIRDPQEGLAQPDRPVWVLAQHYPKLEGTSGPGGASTFNAKTFTFGPLKPGKSILAVWKLSAVKAGDFTLLYRVGAGLGGKAKAETEGGVTPGGSFAVDITSDLPSTEVTDDGEVIDIPERQSQDKSGSE